MIRLIQIVLIGLLLSSCGQPAATANYIIGATDPCRELSVGQTNVVFAAPIASDTIGFYDQCNGTEIATVSIGNSKALSNGVTLSVFSFANSTMRLELKQ